MTSKDQPVVLLGALEPLVREALVAAWVDELTLIHSAEQGTRLFAEARNAKVSAVVTLRDDVALVWGDAPDSLLLVGVSSRSFEVLVCRGRELSSLLNPDPEEIKRVILSWQTGRVSS